ncbi:hypothetical protein CU669_12545 [Paramagnetospirillum kuznetsovii]|uniref:Uncharacterized protein n=1 Tax=Paramagnetospirillum kuznetsovii TaxID=2053833 RepID=A0A364NWU4_9PROT|nr:hypothetical protein [Paramagnetospirillum kuznetsovii]RAU21523.1 hypothetical protein CU669_12545 [Paramagnetospirillum kuznetsovii]
MKLSPLACLMAAVLLGGAASAQTVGPKVPPYQAPAKADPPARAAAPEGSPGFDTGVRPDPFKPQTDVIARFADAYGKGGRPRLAFYWNRQLTDTMAQWYSESRTISTDKSANTTEGDLALKQSGSKQSTVETQRRNADEQARQSRPETWEWEFQDGFLTPFLTADALVVDRTAIMRIMGAGGEDIDPRTVEIMALQNMADLLVEVLVADQPKATTGYELRARILDVKTGRIVAMVNSRSLKEWQRTDKAVATSRGFDIADDDDEGFGPERANNNYKATPSGFEKKRKPPKPAAIAHNLATNVMSGLIPRLEAAQPSVAVAPTAKPPEPKVEDAAPMPITTPPAKAQGEAKPPVETKSKPAPNDSAVPLPEVEAEPLPAPPKATAKPSPPTEPTASAEEPPMPRPTKQ